MSVGGRAKARRSETVAVGPSGRHSVVTAAGMASRTAVNDMYERCWNVEMRDSRMHEPRVKDHLLTVQACWLPT